MTAQAGTTATLVIGLLAYFLFAFYLHALITGVPVMQPSDVGKAI